MKKGSTLTGILKQFKVAGEKARRPSKPRVKRSRPAKKMANEHQSEQIQDNETIATSKHTIDMWIN